MSLPFKTKNFPDQSCALNDLDVSLFSLFFVHYRGKEISPRIKRQNSKGNDHKKLDQRKEPIWYKEMVNLRNPLQVLDRTSPDICLARGLDHFLLGHREIPLMIVVTEVLLVNF